MQYTYERDISGSCLVVKEPALSDGYERRMLQCGGIRGLLEEHAVRLDDGWELRYRIGGMQTLEKCFEKKKLLTEDVTGLLDQMARLQEACAAHLLPDTHLFFSPDLIYIPYLQKEYRFLYLPEEEADPGVQIRLLADFLMKHISYEEPQEAGVEIVYAFQDAARQERFELKEWWLQHRPSDEGTDLHAAAGRQPAENAAAGITAPSDEGPSPEWERKWNSDILQETPKKGRLHLFFMRLFRKTSPPQKPEAPREIPMPEAPCFTDVPEDGGTVCLSEMAEAPGHRETPQQVHTLIPMDGGEEILLNRSFLLIGTAVRNADILLTDPTVSRIHAELFTDEAGVRIEDCNSSNGTMVNGELLAPNEQRLLQTGMHIRLGRSEFVFR